MPREIIPGRFYMLTRRCVQQMFLLRPDRETTQAFWYCVAEAAARCDIELLLPSAMSNHHHTVLFDRYGRVVDFMQRLHEMLARCLNAHRRRRENFWSTAEPNLLHLADRGAVMDRLVYAATNPVKDNLVERVSDWPGANGLAALLSQEPVVAVRPTFFFRRKGRMPATVTLRLVIPPELGDADAVLAELRLRVAQVEAEHAAKRRRTGKRVLGVRRVLAQDPCGAPTRAERFERTLTPKFAARSSSLRLDAIERNYDFLAAYREARRCMLAGQPFAFPVGTYWLARYVGVPIATPHQAAA